jgi:plastocyanin
VEEKMRKTSLKVLSCFILALFVLYQNVQGEDKLLHIDQAVIMQEKLEKAMRELKQEIRSEVKVENPGTISGMVKCKRVSHAGNTVAYIEKVGGIEYDPPKEHGVVDQIKLTFIPHVLAVQKGTIVDFPNNDMIRHNVFSPPDCCNQFNTGTYDVGVTKSITFGKTCAVPLLCNVHAEMSAFVVVLDNPYFAITSRDGSFTIDNVPPGNYTLKTWHEKLLPVTQEVTVEAGKTTDVSFVLEERI